MISFRAQFAPIITDVISSNHESPLPELKRKLRAKWNDEIKNASNEYMASAWSREVSRQLKMHPGNQKPIKELPLFKEMA